MTQTELAELAPDADLGGELADDPVLLELSDPETAVVRGTRFRWADLAIVVGVISVASFPYLVGAVTSGVFGFNSGLATILVGPWLGHNVGLPWLDPNVGYVSQALGHLSATTLLHGHLPWWNPYEGVGSPLAGEGQSAALFPLTLLLATSNGQMWFHFILEIVAGVATQRLLKEMGLSRWVSIVGGIMFGLNGTFAWLTNAAFNPIAFLPIILWGIERCRHRSWREGMSGWFLIALGSSLSIYAGFPETAYLNGLLAAAWAILRFFQTSGAKKADFGVTVAFGGIVGALVSMPFLVAFADATRHADIGGHAGEFANASLPIIAANTLGLPYLFGPLFGFAAVDHSGQLSALWGDVGGYLTAAMIVTAVFGLIAGRDRGLRILLGVWMAITIAKAFNVPAVAHLVNVIPGVSSISFARYIPPSWAMIAVVLGAMGLDRFSNRRVSLHSLRLSLAIAAIIGLGGIALVFIPGRHLIQTLVHLPGFSGYVAASICWAMASVVLIAAIGLLAQANVARLCIGLILIVDSMIMFMVPQLSAPKSIPTNTAVVTYLQRHAGLARFVTLGPIVPNYGSYFSISAANAHDLPLPGPWADYVHEHLETNERPQQFDGATRLNPTGPTPLQEFKRNMAAYQAIGVRYVITDAGFGKGAIPGKRVFLNRYNAVWKLPSAAPFYYTVGASCSLHAMTLTTVSASCAHPTTLVRSELDLPGWSVTNNGAATPLHHAGTLFMKVDLPAGTSNLEFSYLPPHMKWAGLSALLGLTLAVVGIIVPMLMRRSRHKHREVDHLQPEPV